MTKTKANSRIEIWNTKYINNPNLRRAEDEHATIIQIEPVSNNVTENFIVEVTNEEIKAREFCPSCGEELN